VVLSIAEYDSREAEAVIAASYPAVRAFRPAAFTQVNFPVRVTDERELSRYCDIMHELADAEYYYHGELYSDEEAAHISDLSANTRRLTHRIGGREIQPFMCLFPAITMLRAVRALAPTSAKIWEIGPGTGTVGAYLIGSGYRYRAIDNTQALYLWQNRLFSYLADDFAELSSRAIEDGIPEQVAQVPWWQFAKMFEGDHRADIIICDGAMGEMEHFAIWYIIRLAARMLRDSRVGAFIYANIGEQRIASQVHIEQVFALAGFQKTVWGPVTIHTLKPLDLHATDLPKVGAGARAASEFLPIDVDCLQNSYGFFAHMGMNGSAAFYEKLRNRTASKQTPHQSSFLQLLVANRDPIPAYATAPIDAAQAGHPRP